MNKGLISCLLSIMILGNCIIGCNDVKKDADIKKQIDYTLVNKIKESQINCFTKLLYASEEKVIFHGVIGLIIYDLNSKEITNVVDLKSINMNHIQSDDVTIFKIFTDGNKILMYNENHFNDIYIYDAMNNSLKKSDTTEVEGLHMIESVHDENIQPDSDREYSYSGIPISEEKICYLSYPKDIEKGIEDLKIVILDKETKEEKTFDVFK